MDEAWKQRETGRVWQTPDGTIRKQVLRAGHFGRKPTERSKCTALLRNLTSEQPDLEKTVQYVIGDAETMFDRQIERVLSTMSLDEHSTVTIIGGEETRRYDITLLSHQPFPSLWQWCPEEKHTVAAHYNERGKQLYRDGLSEEAFHRFSRGCKLLITLEPIEQEAKVSQLRLVLYNNMAMCQLRHSNYQHAISLCDKVLARDADNVKALYRRGAAYGKCGDLERSVNDLRRVTELDPTNQAARQLLLRFGESLREQRQRCNDMIRRMFSGF